VVVIVSEERGEVSLALAGELQPVTTREQLSARLNTLLTPQSPEVAKVSLRRLLFSNLGTKLTVVALVMISWLAVTGRQGGIVTVMAPIKFRNLSPELTLLKSAPEEVEVQLKTFSRLLSSPKQLEVVAELDLERTREGTNSMAITSNDLQLPLGVVVTGINPSIVKVTTEKKLRKAVRVRVKTVGKLPGTVVLRRIVVEPVTLQVEGPEHLLAQLDSIDTEAVDLHDIDQNRELVKRVLQPAPQVRILGEGEVRIRVSVVER
jgi:YbbR domain-containing protein